MNDKKNTTKELDSDNLWKTVLQVKDMEEARNFFRDLLTEKEIEELSMRWKVVNMLASNINYKEIEKKTGMSSTTIARIQKWLKGGKGGYRLILDRQRKGK